MLRVPHSLIAFLLVIAGRAAATAHASRVQTSVAASHLPPPACFGGAAGFSQGATSVVSGIVVDASGAALEGAAVSVVSVATGIRTTATTDSRGNFTVPALEAGSYDIDVALGAFKSVVLARVMAVAGTASAVRVVLQPGDTRDSEERSRASLDTPGGAISPAAVADVPLISRRGDHVVALLPGSSGATAGGPPIVLGRRPGDLVFSLDGVALPSFGGVPTGRTSSSAFVLRPADPPHDSVGATAGPRRNSHSCCASEGGQAQDERSNSARARPTSVFDLAQTPYLPQLPLDMLEQVSVTATSLTSDVGGTGPPVIRLVTRSGTNSLHGSGYYYHRSDGLNANTWFNLRDGRPKDDAERRQAGARAGGPIVVPGLFDGGGRAFFFVGYEETRQPRTATFDRTILRSGAATGRFRYASANGVSEVDLLALSRAHGQPSSIDPVVGCLLADIRAAASTSGRIEALDDPNRERYIFDLPVTRVSRDPAARADVVVSKAHRLTASGSYGATVLDPKPGGEWMFPGFPVHANQTWTRDSWQVTARSNWSPTIVNEARAGAGGTVARVAENLDAAMWRDARIAYQAGYQLGIDAAGISPASEAGARGTRSGTTVVIEDTVIRASGAHRFSVGASFMQATLARTNQPLVPSVSFGVLSADPAARMFDGDSFPGASTADISAARSLYAVLTGHVSSIDRVAQIDERSGAYVVSGAATERMRSRSVSLFADDSWRIARNVSLGLGVRYDLQLPARSMNGTYSRAAIADVLGLTGISPDFDVGAVAGPGIGYLFQPGVMTGRSPRLVSMPRGTAVSKIDWNNVAPALSVTWAPGHPRLAASLGAPPGHPRPADAGWLRPAAGAAGETLVRGGYSVAYRRPTLSMLADVLAGNPGIAVDASRSQSLGNLGALPLLLADSGRLDAPAVAAARAYPMPLPSPSSSIFAIDPAMQLSAIHSMMVGIERAIGRDFALEARFVTTRERGGFEIYDYNEIDIVENGFLDEFRRAQANLQSNLSAARGANGGANFAYHGDGTGTSPLPVFLAYFSGVDPDHANDATKYRSPLFAAASYVDTLAPRDPAPFSAASLLVSNGTRRAYALAAGLPANFFVANPDALGGANILANGAYRRHDSIQIELRRRLSRGLQFRTNYTFARTWSTSRYSFRKPLVVLPASGDAAGAAHSLKGSWTYELPVGRGKSGAARAPWWLDAIAGGWQLSGSVIVESGRLLDVGNVRLVNMTADELRDMFELRFARDASGRQRVWMLPPDVIDNTVKAFDVSATSPSGYGRLGPPAGRYLAPANGPDCIEVAPGFGDCGTRSVVVAGPANVRLDAALSKRLTLARGVTLELHVEAFNVLNRAAFTATMPRLKAGLATTAGGAAPFEVTSTADDARQLQLAVRINW